MQTVRCGMQDRFLTRIKAGPCIDRMESSATDHQGVPGFTLGVACSMGFDKGIAARIHGYSITE